MRSQLVQVVVKFGDAFFETLSLSDDVDDFKRLRASFEWRTVESGPVIEEALRESLTLGETSEMCGETEGFSDGEESLDLF